MSQRWCQTPATNLQFLSRSSRACLDQHLIAIRSPWIHGDHLRLGTSLIARDRMGPERTGTRGVASSKNVGWTHTHGERAEREPITGVWGQSPQWGPGAEPLVRGSGGQSPPEAQNLLAVGCLTEAANLPHSPYFAKSLTPGIFDTSDKKLKVYRLRWHVLYCVSTKTSLELEL